MRRLLVGAVCAALGFAMGVYLVHRRSERSALTSSLAHELEITGLCVGTLELIDRNDQTRSRQALEQRLAAAISQSGQLTEGGATLPVGTPNLRNTLQRARQYYAERQPDNALIGIAERSLAKLDR